MYTFVNPRTKKSVMISTLEDERLTYSLYESKDDILIVYSSVSCTIKGRKWHYEEYAGDFEGPETLWEVNLPSLLGCRHYQLGVIVADDYTL